MKVPGILIALLAVAIAVVPFFNTCAQDGKALTLANGTQVPMKCFWTAMAEIAVGIPLLGVGGLLAFSRRKETRRSLTILGAILGAFAMLLPTVLVGVCAMPSASCNKVLLPAMLFAGILVIVASLGSLVYSERMPEAVA
jgi:hypothetical protein